MRNLTIFAVLAISAATALAEPQAQPASNPADDPDVKAALAKATYDLKDPESARFRNLFKFVGSRGATRVCGEINAKNSYGAYGGFQRFVATKYGASIAAPDDIAANVLMDTSCVKEVNASKVEFTVDEVTPAH